ncbi:hypothetical protein FB451DRAFT_1298918 [Mycena latifolia]|nr:hypothetical protein FB451DRAFT_1298918 [Mycena latifolia]
MPRRGSAKRRRERAGLPDVKPGRVGWVHGTKLTFMHSFKDAYVKAAELNKYGYHTSWGGDLEIDQDVASDVDSEKDVDALPAEEAEARAVYHKILRTVSNLMVKIKKRCSYKIDGRKSARGYALSSAARSREGKRGCRLSKSFSTSPSSTRRRRCGRISFTSTRGGFTRSALNRALTHDGPRCQNGRTALLLSRCTTR